MPDSPLVKLWTGKEKAKVTRDPGMVLPGKYVNFAEQATFLSSIDQLCRLEVPSTLISALAFPAAKRAEEGGGMMVKAERRIEIPIRVQLKGLCTKCKRRVKLINLYLSIEQNHPMRYKSGVFYTPEYYTF
jgi:hypothetical protein